MKGRKNSKKAKIKVNQCELIMKTLIHKKLEQDFQWITSSLLASRAPLLCDKS